MQACLSPLALVLCLAAPVPPADPGSARFLIRVDGKSGYIDRTGAVVIPPQYEAAGEFSEGLAAVKVGASYGAIDPAGKLVVPARFELVHAFRGGRARVVLGKKTGFIDRNGKLVIPAAFDAAQDFSEGLAGVQVGKLWGFVDEQGRRIVAPRFSSVEPFASGLALVDTGKGLAFVDRTGKTALPAEGARGFSEGLAPKAVEGKWGFMDKTGALVVPATFEAVEKFSGGLARAQQGGKWGFVDRTGKFVIEPRFSLLQDFSEDLAVAADGDYGYLDRTGRFALAPRHLIADDFHDGLARVGNTPFSMDHFIDRKGRYVYRDGVPERRVAADFQQGPGGFRENARWKVQEGVLVFQGDEQRVAAPESEDEGAEGAKPKPEQGAPRSPKIVRALHRTRLDAEVDCEVRVRFTGGDERAAAGLVFDYANPSHYLAVAISQQRVLTVLRRTPKGWEQVMPRRVSSLVRKGWNTLRVSALGPAVQVMVNGTLLQAFPSTGERGPAAVGVFAESDAAVQFDDFRAAEIPATWSAGTASAGLSLDDGFDGAEPTVVLPADWEVRDGALWFNGGAASMALHLDDVAPNGVVSVKTAWKAGSTAAAAGLAFRVESATSFHLFLVGTDGRVAVMEVKEGKRNFLLPWKKVPWGRDSENTLQVELDGTKLVARLNAIPVAELTLPVPRSGYRRVGFFAEGSTRISFDGLRLREKR